MSRGVHRILHGIVFCALLFHATILEASLSSAHSLLAATLTADRLPLSHRWLYRIQSDEPLPSDQRDVLEQLLETPSAADLKPVVELYLNRNRKLSDKDAQTFSTILKTARELEKLEAEKAANVEPAPPTETNEEREDVIAEPARPTEPEPTVDGQRSPEPENDGQPSPPSVDLDFLYHGTKPMRPL